LPRARAGGFSGEDEQESEEKDSAVSQSRHELQVNFSKTDRELKPPGGSIESIEIERAVERER
jgi:hypothetical protein